jgi:hypothetical protein
MVWDEPEHSRRYQPPLICALLVGHFPSAATEGVVVGDLLRSLWQDDLKDDKAGWLEAKLLTPK